MGDCWNPEQYKKYQRERSQPFFDLMALVQPQPEMSVVDVGCGTGELTQILHQTLKAKTTLGFDSSSAMLQESERYISLGLSFELLDVEDYAPEAPVDLIFSNAVLQWVPHPPQLLERLSQQLTAQGQLAIQVPANFDYPTHTLARELSRQSPFKEQLAAERDPSILKIEEYSQLLYHLGFSRQLVRCQVYPVVLEST